MTAFARRYYAGGGTTTILASSMSASDTSFTISSATGWPGSPGNPYIVVIDRGTSSEEKILCTSNSGTTVTVTTRGYDGTSATTHNASATVSLCGGAIDFDEANQLTNLMGNGAEGSLFYGKGTGTLPAKLAVGTAGQLLTNNGTDPAWLTALAEGSLLYGKGTTTNPAALAVGSANQILLSNGTDPAWGALNYVESYISGLVALTTANTIYNITNVSLSAGTWDITWRGFFENGSASAGMIADLFIGPTSTSVTSAYATATGTATEQGATLASYLYLHGRKVVVLTSTTTVYMEAQANQSLSSVQPGGALTGIANASGITAVQLGK